MGLGVDQYRRILAYIYIDGLDVNLELVKAGLAEVYRGKANIARQAELVAAEREAKTAKRGMWALGDKYENPYHFRQRLRIRGD